jgi:hypothetical protein
VNTNPDLLAFALRLAAAGQIFIAAVGSLLPRLLNWRDAVDRMPLLVREVFQIHTWFISLTCAIFGLLTWRFADDLAHGRTLLGAWLCVSIAFFWGLRSILQWLHYSPSHWRGNRRLTLAHWTLFLGYAAWAGVYLAAALR